MQIKSKVGKFSVRVNMPPSEWVGVGNRPMHDPITSLFEVEWESDTFLQGGGALSVEYREVYVNAHAGMRTSVYTWHMSDREEHSPVDFVMRASEFDARIVAHVNLPKKLTLSIGARTILDSIIEEVMGYVDKWKESNDDPA